jgi:hypothetical protein
MQFTGAHHPHKSHLNPTGLHRTPRWREMDLNFQFLVARLSTVMGDGPAVPRPERICCGTERFESISLQERVCELSVPEREDALPAPP